MNTDYNQPNDQFTPAYPPMPPSRVGKIVALVAILGFGVAAFGAACLFGGMHLMKYVDRLETLERGATRVDSIRSYPPRDPGRATVVASAPETLAAPGQPQIYFMMGAQPQPAQAMMSPYLQPDMSTEMNQFILGKYQAEFTEFMRQRMAHYPAAAHTQGAFNYVPSLISAGAPAARSPYVSVDIQVPAKMTLDLKRRYSRNTTVEDWFRDEVAVQQAGPVREGDDTSSDPDMDQVLRQLAETTFADGQYERTSRVYAELASRGVSLSSHELQRWAKATELAGDRESAVRILELVLKNDPDNAAVLQEQANLMVADQKFSAAAEYYRRLMDLQPTERQWRTWRAKTLTWANRGQEAIDLMRELYKEDPSDAEFNLMLAELLLSEHLFEESLPILDTLIQHDKTDYSLKERKMNALMGLHRFKEAADIAGQLLARDPENLDLMLKQAVNLVAAGEFNGAVAPFRKYLAIKPDDLVVRKQYAECLMAAQRFSEAAKEYATISGAEVDNDEIRKKLANAHMAAEEWRPAAAVYSELVQLYPEDAEINLGLITSTRMSGDIDHALGHAREYLRVDPYDTQILILASEMSMEQKNPKDALPWFRTALKLDPENFEARLKYADALVWNMEYEAAESEYRRVLNHDPEHFLARRGLARTLFYLRKYKESFQIYRELSWEDPNGTIVEEYRLREATASAREDASTKVLQNLQELEPEDITWKGDRYQSLLRQHRFPEARAQARIVVEQDPDHRATLLGERNMNDYLTFWPVTLRGGMLRKSSKSSADEQNDRHAKLTYTYIGVHGEKSITPHVRAYADLDREKFNMRERGVSNLASYRLKLGAMFMGHPNLTGRADIGYRWFQGSDKKVHGERRSVDDQWLYNLRADMKEIAGTSLRVGFYSARREHYDNFRNAYDDLYAYDFGLDAGYRYRKWDFFANIRSSVLTDNNTAFYGHIDAKYRLYETPCLLLTVGGNVEYESWNETRDTYYSPKDQSRIGVEIDGRYWLCRDPEVWGQPSSYIDFGLSVYRDRFSNMGQKVYFGFNHDYSTRFSVFARADFNRESYYNEVKLFAGLTYRFGGCK